MIHMRQCEKSSLPLHQAYHEFSDAVFSACAHPFVADVLHYSEMEEEEEEELSAAEDENKPEKKKVEGRRKRVHISQIYLDLKRKQVKKDINY